MQTIGPADQNPLKKYFRQPKLFINLPSKGKFYPAGAIDIPANGEFPVYPMTARDELTIKTPDALLNGSATVEMIQSCVPNIKNAWNMPSIDLDAVLIAIRIATYGEILEVKTRIPGANIEKDYNVDLRQVLGHLTAAHYDYQLTVGNMQVELRPMSYREFTENALKTFEEQRIFALVNNDTMSDQEKLAKFAESFVKLTHMTINMLSHNIAKIIVDDTEVTNPAHIQDFIDNADKEFYNYITEHLAVQRAKFQIQPMLVKPDAEEIAAGAPESFEVPITFDQSNFFV